MRHKLAADCNVELPEVAKRPSHTRMASVESAARIAVGIYHDAVVARNPNQPIELCAPALEGGSRHRRLRAEEDGKRGLGARVWPGQGTGERELGARDWRGTGAGG